jgi:hypothetical protein
MTPFKHLTKLFILLALPCLLAVPALARHHDDDVRTFTLIDEDGETYICTLTDGEGFRVVHRDSGEEIIDFDFESIEGVVEEAMTGVHAALQALNDLEIDVRFGTEQNRLSFAFDDEDFEIDVDAIVADVMEAIEGIDFSEIDLDEIHVRHDGHDGRDDLSRELDRLRDEIRELKRELRKAKASDFDFD